MASFAYTWNENAWKRLRPSMSDETFVDLVCNVVGERDRNYVWVIRKTTSLLGQGLMAYYLEQVRYKLLVQRHFGNTAGGLLIKEIKLNRGKDWWNQTFKKRTR